MPPAVPPATPGPSFPRVWLNPDGPAVVVLTPAALPPPASSHARRPRPRLAEAVEALCRRTPPDQALGPAARSVPLPSLVDATVDLRSARLTLTHLAGADTARTVLDFAPRAAAEAAAAGPRELPEEETELRSQADTPGRAALLPGAVAAGVALGTALAAVAAVMLQKSVRAGRSPVPPARGAASLLDYRFLLYELGAPGVLLLGGML